MRALLETQLGRVEVECAEPGARVTLDGKQVLVGPGRHASIVKPGEHQIVASKPGRIPDTQEVTLAAGEKKLIRLHLQATRSVTLQRRWPVWLPYAVAGASTVFLASGAYFDRVSSRGFADYAEQFDALCQEGCLESQLSPELRATLQRADRQQNTARVLYAAGGMVVLGAAVLLYLNQERAVSGRDADDDTGTRSAVDGDSGGSQDLALVPYVASDGAGATASIHF